MSCKLQNPGQTSGNVENAHVNLFSEQDLRDFAILENWAFFFPPIKWQLSIMRETVYLQRFSPMATNTTPLFANVHDSWLSNSYFHVTKLCLAHRPIMDTRSILSQVNCNSKMQTLFRRDSDTFSDTSAICSFHYV